MDVLKKWGTSIYHCDMNLAVMVKRKQFKKPFMVLDRYDSFEDWPWFLFYKKLDRKFPNTKFILTIRKDIDAYIKSLRNHHIRERCFEDGFVKSSWWDPVFDFNKGDYELAAREYEKYNLEVIDYFKSRPDDLLVVCWEHGDAWEEICKFLGKEIPQQDFPHLNHHTDSLES